MELKEEAFSIAASDGQMIRGRYRDTGEGPVGVFLHGLLSDAEGTKSMHLWNYAETFNRSWLRFDMRAHGQSDGTFDEFTISRAIEDSTLAMGLFKDRQKVLVGSSMGGWVAAQLALDPSLNICGLVLIAPAFNFMNKIYLDLSPEEQSQWQETGYRLIESPYPDSDFRLSYAAVVDSRQYDLFSHPVKYEHRVHILHGILDDVVPATQSDEFRKHIDTDSAVDFFPDGDHRLSEHLDNIEAAADAFWPDPAHDILDALL